MYQYDFPYRVRYADVDQMGYMYYGHYARLFEIGRVEALRNLGLRYRDFEENGIIMPVYENKSRYLSPAKYDELLTIRVKLEKLPSARIVFHYDIISENGDILNKGETTLVFVKMENNKLVPCPSNMIEALRPYFA